MRFISWHVKNLEESTKKIYEAVFQDKKTVEVDGKTYNIRRTSSLALRVVEVEAFTFLEQNPEKNSVWGKLAKEGHKILWVIEDGDYVAQVWDGVFHDFNKIHTA